MVQYYRNVIPKYDSDCFPNNDKFSWVQLYEAKLFYDIQYNRTSRPIVADFYVINMNNKCTNNVCTVKVHN